MDPTDYLGLVGCALSVNEKTAVRCSLEVLKQKLEVPNSTFRLWGKVQGYNKDYLIAQKLGENLLDPSVSFYSIDGGTNWAKLEEVTDLQREFCIQIRGPFMGDPGYEYKIRKDLPPEEPAAVDPDAVAAQEAIENEQAPEDVQEPEDEGGEGDEEGLDDKGEEPVAEGEDEAEEKKPEKKKPKFQIIAIAEAVRLCHFITEHDKACCIVPRGAYLLSNTNSIVRNKTFKGLDVEQATLLKNYFHLARELDPTVNQNLFGPNYAQSRDFLVSIVNDIPDGVWTVKYDATMGVVVLQSMDYLGAVFFLKVNAPEFAQFYFGNAERNLDLCFNLP